LFLFLKIMIPDAVMLFSFFISHLVIKDSFLLIYKYFKNY